MKWEYQGIGTNCLNDCLKSMGEIGWELVSCERRSWWNEHRYELIFKRQATQ